MHKETELKLLVEEADLDRPRWLDPLRPHIRQRPKTKALASVYYDTETLELAARQLTLRVRQTGGRHILGIKAQDGRMGGGLFARREWEMEVGAAEPDLQMLKGTAVGGLLGTALLGSEVRPLFATEVRRTTYQLAGDGFEVEMAVDRGRIVLADGTTQPIAEIELELLRGEPWHLYRLALDLHGRLPVQLATFSKSDRGYALVRQSTPEPFKAKSPAVDPAMTAGESFRAIAHGCLAHIQANVPSLTASRAPDAVHQMRVAVRRLRSALKIFRSILRDGAPDEGLRWLAGELGPARDTDVFIAEILDPVAQRFPADKDLAALIARFRDERAHHYECAEAAVRSPAFTRLLLDLGLWIETGVADSPEAAAPVIELAVATLSKRRRRLRKKGGKDLTKLTAEQRHEVRIDLKKLRYACEFFAPLWPAKQTTAGIAELTELQQSLGELSDIAVAHDLLLDHAAGAAPGVIWAAGLAHGWHASREAGLLTAVQERWKGWRKRSPFWE